MEKKEEEKHSLSGVWTPKLWIMGRVLYFCATIAAQLANTIYTKKHIDHFLSPDESTLSSVCSWAPCTLVGVLLPSDIQPPHQEEDFYN